MLDTMISWFTGCAHVESLDATTPWFAMLDVTTAWFIFYARYYDFLVYRVCGFFTEKTDVIPGLARLHSLQHGQHHT